MENMVNDNFWLDRPVLVTGGTGLLGSWLVQRLIQAGADITCLVRDWVPQSELIKSGLFSEVKVVRGDIRDIQVLDRIMSEYEVDTVFHLAAQTIVTIANRNPLYTLESNIAGTWNVLEAARRNTKVKQIVVASSDKAYGDQKDLPYNEDTPLQGQHPYDVSKSCADLVSQMYAKSFNLPVCVTRCGNFYGGGDLNWNRIIPGTIRSILRGQAPVIRSDGKFIRDYFYVEDGANAYMVLAEKMAEKPELMGEAFNFSNELQVTVLDIVNKILRIMKSNLEPVVLNETSNEIRHQYLSAAKARKKLNWEPLFTLDEGLEKTINWYKEFFHSQPNKSLSA
jgi:CDP-glucose 4,6-dehydratase